MAARLAFGELLTDCTRHSHAVQAATSTPSPPGGKLVFVALPAENETKLPIFETVLNGITVVGSIVGTRTDLREVFALHAAGWTSVIREVRPLEDVDRAIAYVEAGRVAARVVLDCG